MTPHTIGLIDLLVSLMMSMAVILIAVLYCYWDLNKRYVKLVREIDELDKHSSEMERWMKGTPPDVPKVREIALD